VALSSESGLINSIAVRSAGYSHAEKLHVLIDEVLRTSKTEKSGIQAIGISKGPGSYTGLRIGVSAAKGLAYALGIPLLSCTSLETLVDQMRRRSPGYDVYLPMLDARRMEVYCQEYNSGGITSAEIEAKVIDPDSFSHLKGSKVLFAGDGAMKCADVLKEEGWDFMLQFPEALSMGSRMQQAWNEQRFEDVAYFEPYYLKAFIAGAPKRPLG
jgi:tRNA threonylcarbamoyladenosine biosynthesis protein TsaB